MFSQEVIKLALPCVEVLGKLGEVSKIPQQEMIRQAKESIAKKEHGKYKLVYKKNTKTIVAEPRKWKWQPKVGQAFVEYEHKKLHFIRDVFIKEGCDIKIWDYYGREFGVNRHKLTPILHWENDIEPILKGFGYTMQFEGLPGEQFICEIFREIDSSSATAVKAKKVFLCRGAGKYRQTAAMEAIIQLSEGVER